RRHQPALNFARDFQIALHRHLVGQFHRQQEQETQRRKQLIKISVTLCVHSGKYEQAQRNKEENPARRRHLRQQRPENLFSYLSWTSPAWKFIDALPVDIFAVKTVTGLCVSGKLRPQIAQFLALADAVPQAISANSALCRGRRYRWRSCGRGHESSVAQQWRDMAMHEFNCSILFVFAQRTAKLNLPESESIAQRI